MKEIKDILLRVTSGILTNIVWQVILALFVPALTGAVVFTVGGAKSLPFGAIAVFVTIIVLWILSMLGLVVWYNSRKRNHEERSRELAESMFRSDIVLAERLHANNQDPSPEDLELLKTLVIDLLRSMTITLALRVDSARKAASFLVLSSEDLDAPFELFAYYNHPEPSKMSGEVRSILTRERGLAGKAVRDGGCITIHDCRKATEEQGWIHNTTPLRFRGRAAARVRVTHNDHPRDVGALCFDIGVPWTLTPEDAQLMLLYAQKVGALWSLLNRSGAVRTVPRPKGATNRRKPATAQASNTQ